MPGSEKLAAQERTFASLPASKLSRAVGLLIGRHYPKRTPAASTDPEKPDRDLGRSEAFGESGHFLRVGCRGAVLIEFYLPEGRPAVHLAKAKNQSGCSAKASEGA